MGINDIIEKKNMSTYKLAGITGIPYSTLSDIVSGKTDIKSVSSSILYRLSKGLDMSMEELYLSGEGNRTLYLYNKGRNVEICIGTRRFSYMGPKNLVGFRNIVDNRNNVLSVDTYFINENGRIYVEEDYIDLNDIFEGYGELLITQYDVAIGRPGQSRTQYLIDNSVMITDNMAILIGDNGTDDIVMEVTNMKRNKENMMIRLKDYAVLFSNMSRRIEERAVATVKNNRALLEEEVEERKRA